MPGKITPTPLPESPVVETTAEFGAFIRSLRTQHQIRIDDAAALCNVSVQLLSDLENGRRSVGIDKALRVAQQLGVALLATPKSELPNILSRMKKNK